MLPLDWYLHQIANTLIGALPILLALFGGFGILAWSPLGKGLVRFLHDRHRAASLSEETLAELGEVSRTLVGISERLDATERLLARAAQAPLVEVASARQPRELTDSDRVPTPV